MAQNILFVNSSARGDYSESKGLAEQIVAKLTAENPGATVVRRDVATDLPPAVSMDWILGAYTPAETHSEGAKAAMAKSDEYVDELLAADVLVLAAPMYNFAVPATLKLWIDQVCRVNRTFTPSYQGLAKAKVFVASARGGAGYGPGQMMENNDFVVSYLKAVLGFIGMTDVTFLDIENTASTANPNYQMTKARAAEVVATLAA